MMHYAQSHRLDPRRPVIVKAADLPDVSVPEPNTWLRALWKRYFGAPEVELPKARSDVGVFRALYEIGSDYLPSSGTWPTR